jgi:hypothetical protein
MSMSSKDVHRFCGGEAIVRGFASTDEYVPRELGPLDDEAVCAE